MVSFVFENSVCFMGGTAKIVKRRHAEWKKLQARAQFGRINGPLNYEPLMRLTDDHPFIAARLREE